MTKQLTDRQTVALDAITDAIDETGYPPTIRELGDVLGIASTNGVNDHLKALERKGYIKRDGAQARGLTPLRYSNGRKFRSRAALIKAADAAGASAECEALREQLEAAREEARTLAASTGVLDELASCPDGEGVWLYVNNVVVRLHDTKNEHGRFVRARRGDTDSLIDSEPWDGSLRSGLRAVRALVLSARRVVR